MLGLWRQSIASGYSMTSRFSAILLLSPPSNILYTMIYSMSFSNWSLPLTIWNLISTNRERSLDGQPVNSPSLNPIENLWSNLQSKIYSCWRQYKTKDYLWDVSFTAARNVLSGNEEIGIFNLSNIFHLSLRMAV